MFLLRLAGHYRATPREILARFSFPELFMMWQFSSIEPFGFPQQDYHAATVAHTVANFAGRSVKEPISLKEFLSVVQEDEDNDDSIDNQIAMLTAVLG